VSRVSACTSFALVAGVSAHLDLVTPVANSIDGLEDRIEAGENKLENAFLQLGKAFSHGPSSPEHGYWGRSVKHENLRSATTDWAQEYGPKNAKNLHADESKASLTSGEASSKQKSEVVESHSEGGGSSGGSSNSTSDGIRTRVDSAASSGKSTGSGTGGRGQNGAASAGLNSLSCAIALLALKRL